MILNLTQHASTPDQIAAGVVDLPADVRAQAGRLLNFDTLPTWEGVLAAAAAAVALVQNQGHHGAVMIGGAPFLMAPLSAALAEAGYQPVYAFSRRESVEIHNPDGSVTKAGVFRHAGFVQPSGAPASGNSGGC